MRTFDPSPLARAMLAALLVLPLSSQAQLPAQPADETVTIPMIDAQLHDVIIAHAINDRPIGVQELGPLLVMYPFDSKPQLQTTQYHRRSVWQLESLRVD